MSLQSRISSLRPSRRGRTRGQALVELALILPVMVLLLAAALDLGRLFYSGITVTNSAREGAIEAGLNPDSFQAGQPCNKTSNRVMCRAVNEASGSFVTIVPADVSLTCTPSCTPAIGNNVKVTVVGHFSLITPLLSVFTGGQNVTLTSTASAQIITAPILGSPSTPAPTASPTPTPTPTPVPSTSVAPTPSGSPTPVPSPVCIAPTNVTLSVSPTSGFRYKNPGKPGTTFQFSTSASNMNEPLCHPIWSWNFGDGAGTSSLISPQYVYNAANTSPGFTVTVAASNDGGNSSASFILRVDNP
jgi:Flp pilus assembly protein TadG